MEPFPEFAEFQELLDALCEDRIDDSQFKRLEQLLLQRPEAEAHYVQYIGLQCGLEQELTADLESHRKGVRFVLGLKSAPRWHSASSEGAAGRRRGRRTLVWASLASSVIGLGLLFVAIALWQSVPQSPVIVKTISQPVVHDPGNGTVAVLRKAVNAVWSSQGLQLNSGAALPPGPLRLESGAAEIEFYSGAVVVLVAPFEVRLVSPVEMYCAKGQIRARVPAQAQGFKVRSPRVNVVDLGTEFGIDVRSDAATEVHVFEGKVELYQPGIDGPSGLIETLTSGHAFRFAGDRKAFRATADKSRFLSQEELSRMVAESASRKYAAWKGWSETIRQDPALLLYFPFEDAESDGLVVKNQSASANVIGNGTCVSRRLTTGRWKEKQALKFGEPSDGVRVDVPGVFESLTMAIWVKADSIDKQINSLFLTDGWDTNEAHWYITRTGMLQLAVNSEAAPWGPHYLAFDAFQPSLLKSWTLLAVVYDHANKSVSHYINGRAVRTTPIDVECRFQFGKATLGNWSDAPEGKRVFQGEIDEFLLFSRALSAAEIADMYEQGRPE